MSIKLYELDIKHTHSARKDDSLYESEARFYCHLCGQCNSTGTRKFISENKKQFDAHHCCLKKTFDELGLGNCQLYWNFADSKELFAHSKEISEAYGVVKCTAEY